jgi:signal transduction histidine kinase
MHSATMPEASPAAESIESFDRIYASLAEGLHALAQPLTILRSSIPALCREEAGTEKQRNYLRISKYEVERACELFGAMQDLLIAARSHAERAPVEPVERRELA